LEILEMPIIKNVTHKIRIKTLNQVGVAKVSKKVVTSHTTRKNPDRKK